MFATLSLNVFIVENRSPEFNSYFKLPFARMLLRKVWIVLFYP